MQKDCFQDNVPQNEQFDGFFVGNKYVPFYHVLTQ
jgi:hypothetical protein